MWVKYLQWYTSQVVLLFAVWLLVQDTPWHSVALDKCLVGAGVCKVNLDMVSELLTYFCCCFDFACG
jgi:hypothetical protein